MTTEQPERYEDTNPEDAQILAGICNRRATKRGKQRTLYLDVTEPIVRDGEKIGRNASCPCGSDIKFKKCCGKA